MKREKNISRRVALKLWLHIIVVVFILVAALGVIEVNPGLGYTILVGDVIYLIAAVLCYEYTEKMISKEFLAAGFEQSQIQKQILKYHTLTFHMIFMFFLCDTVFFRLSILWKNLFVKARKDLCDTLLYDLLSRDF